MYLNSYILAYTCIKPLPFPSLLPGQHCGAFGGAPWGDGGAGAGDGGACGPPCLHRLPAASWTPGAFTAPIGGRVTLTSGPQGSR